MRRLYRVLAIATTAMFLVAAFGLVIAMVVGLIERRRPFALLRAAGTPVSTLRRALVLEATVPLAVMAVVAAVLGASTGALITSSNGYTPARSGLWPPLVVGLLLALVVILPASAVVDRSTRTSSTRFE